MKHKLIADPISELMVHADLQFQMYKLLLSTLEENYPQIETYIQELLWRFDEALADFPDCLKIIKYLEGKKVKNPEQIKALFPGVKVGKTQRVKSKSIAKIPKSSK